MKAVKFSVIIPLFNKEKHISRSLNSVLAQTIKDFEIIVVDDGSTDNGAEIVRSYSDNRIRLIHQRNSGVSAARNMGIEEASASLIAFLDADDAWEPEFLETIALLERKFPQAGAYATGYVIRKPDGSLQIPKFKAIPEFPREVLIPSYFKAGIYGDMPVWASAVCIPKSVFQDVGMFPVGEKLGEDHDMWARIALKHPIAFSWSTGATYYQDSDNRACNNSTPQGELLFIRRLQKSLDNCEVPLTYIDDIKRFIGIQLIHVAAINIKAGNQKVARQVLADQRTSLFPRERFWWLLWSYVPNGAMAYAWRLKRNIKELISG